MVGFPPIPRLAKPTGPTGILSSNRPSPKAGGKRTLGGSKGLTGTPMKKLGKR